MEYRDILVHLDKYRGAETRLALAIALAAKHQARLRGFYGFDLPPAPAPPRIVGGLYAEDVNAVAAYERERDSAYSDAAHIEARFHAAAREAGIASDWQICSDKAANLASFVTEQARYADLAVVGQADADHPFFDGLATLPEAVMMGCGRPVLVVPFASEAATLGKNVLVAWNASREAARAVGDAMPLLQAAETVTVVSVGPSYDAPRDEPEGTLVAYLAEHGIRAAASHLVANGLDAGALILAQAADLGCDLLVMGGYGHSRTRELILGGVTRAVLHEMNLPVLMSH